MTAAAPTGTIGVAIALPEPLATDLRRMRREAGDPHADTVPPHVTFLPPSVVSSAALEPIERHLATVAQRHAPFELHLLGAGTFRPVSQVVFAQVSEGLATCELIASDVCSGPLAIDRAFPYHPHVTVAHDVADAELDRTYARLSDFDVRVRVSQFTMFEQSTDERWRSRRILALGHRAQRAGRVLERRVAP